MNYFARDYGILPNTNVTEKLSSFLKSIKDIKEEKTLILEKGEYYLSSDKCEKSIYYITNTIGEKEYKKTESPYLHTVGIHIKNIDNLTIDGNGANFFIDGVMTHIVISECENIKFKDFNIKVNKPNLHKITVKKISPFYIDYEIDKRSDYVIENGNLFFVGKDYKLKINEGVNSWGHFIKTFSENNKRVSRSQHPLKGGLKIKELAPYLIRVFYIKKFPVEINQDFYIFDTRRIEVGVFIEKSKNITFENFSQDFNYSLAFVCQDSENLYFDRLNLSNESFGVCSLADFLQICMCRGEVIVKNCYFSGAGDDIANIHGFHFEIAENIGNSIKAEFKHPQSFGFNAFREGDVIQIVNKKTLALGETATIKSVKVLTPYIIELILDKTLNVIPKENCLENISANPKLYRYENNVADRIVTRGLLITTRAKVEILNNTFESTYMSGILISNDACSWYESGVCRDILIKGNEFKENYSQCIYIWPENKIHEQILHSGIKIVDNTFTLQKQKCINIKSSGNIEILGNKFLGEKHDKLLYLTNTENILTDIAEDKILKK